MVKGEKKHSLLSLDCYVYKCIHVHVSICMLCVNKDFKTDAVEIWSWRDFLKMQQLL